MPKNKKLKSLNIGNLIFAVYFLAWAFLMADNFPTLTLAVSIDIFPNALIISLFIGLGLNVKAFQLQNKKQTYKSLHDRYRYIHQNIGGVITFFAIPFLVSSATSVAITGKESNLMGALFGTNNIWLILSLGFVICIFLPAVYLYHRYGWR